MSLEKSIKHKKEKRKPYYGRGKHTRGCRPHGSCSYCLCSRMHSKNKKQISILEQLKEL